MVKHERSWSSIVFVVLISVLLIATSIALSWGLVAVIYWLITICFGLTFDFLHATGIWLIMLLISVATGGSLVKVNAKYKY